MSQMLKDWFEEAMAKGARSSALQPLLWLTVIFASALVSAAQFHAPDWVLKVLAVILCFNTVIIIFVYVYLLFRDRDALRSERFSMYKMAMERGLIGDNITGLIELKNNAKLVESSPIADMENPK